MQHNAPTGGAVGDPSVDVSAGSVGRRRGPGSLIPHAGAIRALVIAMIEAAFRADPMPAARGADRGAAGGRPTRRRAKGVAPITRRADREQAVAAPADFLAKRRVHVGAAAHSNWTRTRNRDTTDSDRSRSVGASRRSPRVWRGKTPGPHLAVPSAYAARAVRHNSRRTERRGCGR